MVIAGPGQADVLTGIMNAVATGGGAATVGIQGVATGIIATFTLSAPELTLGSNRLRLSGIPLTTTASGSAVPALLYLNNRAGNAVLTAPIGSTGAFDIFAGPGQMTSGNTQTLNELVLYFDSGVLKAYGSLAIL